MNLELFKNKELGEVRVLVDENNEPWFVGKEIAEILGYEKPNKMYSRIDDEDKKTAKLQFGASYQKAIIINESGLYTAILGSKKPQAKKFKKWVTSEVLPSIRKYGMYMTDNLLEKTLENPDFLIDLLQKYKKEREEKRKLQEKVNILTHTKKLYTTTEIAKELGFRSAIELNKKLQEMGIQFEVNGVWVLSAEYADLGYESIKQDVLDNGIVIYNRKWTQSGRKFILGLFNKVA